MPKLPRLDTLQQFHIVKPLLGQANTPTCFFFLFYSVLHPVFDSQSCLFRDTGEIGDYFFNQTKERNSVGGLGLERFTERFFRQALLPLSSAVGEDCGSATVLWCICRPTQLNKHTYVMLSNIPYRNDTCALQNLLEKSGGESMCLSFLR